MFFILLAAQLAGSPAAAIAAPVPAPQNAGFAAPALDDAMLRRTTARGSGDQNASSTLTAVSSNNSVSGSVTTGAVTFSDNSFQGASGLTMVNSNSGNNVAINSAMTVNIQITPGQ